MNPAKCKERDYINFLIATPKSCSGLEAARVEPSGDTARNAYTRLLHRLEPDDETLWQESEITVEKNKGILVVDAAIPGLEINQAGCYTNRPFYGIKPPWKKKFGL